MGGPSPSEATVARHESCRRFPWRRAWNHNVAYRSSACTSTRAPPTCATCLLRGPRRLLRRLLRGRASSFSERTDSSAVARCGHSFGGCQPFLLPTRPGCSWVSACPRTLSAGQRSRSPSPQVLQRPQQSDRLVPLYTDRRRRHPHASSWCHRCRCQRNERVGNGRAPEPTHRTRSAHRNKDRGCAPDACRGLSSRARVRLDLGHIGPRGHTHSHAVRPFGPTLGQNAPWRRSATRCCN